jgi:parallel beta-helix repeat protein
MRVAALAGVIWIGLFGALRPALALVPAVRTIYVAANGDDSWSGGLASANRTLTDGPFRTFARAQQAVRTALVRSSGVAVRVLVRGGRYLLTAPLALDARDSGTQQRPVIWRALRAERPVLIGGQRILHWLPYAGQILQADRQDPRSPAPRSLFLDGVPQVRARRPKADASNPLYGGWAFMRAPVTPDSSTYPDSLLDRPLRKPTQAEIFRIVGPNGGWGSDVMRVTGIDYERHLVRTSYGMGMDPILGFNPNCRFIVENDLALLERPGEWCVDTEAGKLYFRPPKRLTDQDEVTVPTMPSLLTLTGAEWITIEGLAFTQTASGGRSGVVCRNSRHIRLLRNRFLDAGGMALEILGDSQPCVDVTVRGNEVARAGECGIYVGGAVRGCLIADNEVHHCGLRDKYSAGIEFPFYGGSAQDVGPRAFTDGITIAHNFIHDLPRDGIQLGANPWGRNVVEGNRMERTALETLDAGAIRCHRVISHLHGVDNLPPMAGHVIRDNLIVDTRGCGVTGGAIVTPYPWPTFGIYLDEGSSNCLVQRNIVVRSGAGIIINPGAKNRIDNNLFIGNAIGLCFQEPAPFPGRNVDLGGNLFAHNVVVASARGDIALRLQSTGSNALGICDWNLYGNGAGPVTIISQGGPSDPAMRLSLADWKRRGYDRHSRVACWPQRGARGVKRGERRRGDLHLRKALAWFPDARYNAADRALGIRAIDVTRFGIRPGWRPQ